MGSTAYNTQSYINDVPSNASTDDDDDDSLYDDDIDMSTPPPKPPTASAENETALLDCIPSTSKGVVNEIPIKSDAFVTNYLAASEETPKTSKKVHATQRWSFSELNKKALEMVRYHSEEEYLEKCLSTLNLEGHDQTMNYKPNRKTTSETWADEVREKGLRLPETFWFTAETTAQDAKTSNSKQIKLKRTSLHAVERTKSKSFETLLESKKSTMKLKASESENNYFKIPRYNTSINSPRVRDSIPFNFVEQKIPTTLETLLDERKTNAQEHKKLELTRKYCGREQPIHAVETSQIDLNEARDEREIKVKLRRWSSKIEEISKMRKRQLEECESTSQRNVDSIKKKFHAMRAPSTANSHISTDNSQVLDKYDKTSTSGSSHKNDHDWKRAIILRLKRQADRERRIKEIEEKYTKTPKRSVELLKIPVKEVLDKTRLHRRNRSQLNAEERKKIKNFKPADVKNVFTAYTAIRVAKIVMRPPWGLEAPQSSSHITKKEKEDNKMKQQRRAGSKTVQPEEAHSMLEYVGLQPTPCNSLDGLQPRDSLRDENINMRTPFRELNLFPRLDTSLSTLYLTNDEPDKTESWSSELGISKAFKRKSKILDLAEDESILKKYRQPQNIEDKFFKPIENERETNERLRLSQNLEQSLDEQDYVSNKLDSDRSKTFYDFTDQHASGSNNNSKRSKQIEIQSEYDAITKSLNNIAITSQVRTTTQFIENPCETTEPSTSFSSAGAASLTGTTSTSSLSLWHSVNGKCSF